MNSKIKNFINKNVNVFTNYNIILFTLSYYRPKIYNNNVNYDFLYSICFHWNYLIFFTFNSAYFIDNTCFIRMAKRKKISIKTFHIGNIILHDLPFIYVNIYLPKNVNFIHSFLGCFTNLLWCYFATNKTFDFDYVYIDLKKKDLIKLYLINISSILYVPLSYNLNNYLRKTI